MERTKKSGEKCINDYLTTCVRQSNYPSARKKTRAKLRDAQHFRKSKGKKKKKKNSGLELKILIQKCMPLTVLVAKSSIFYSHVFMIANGHLGDVGVIGCTLKVIVPIKPL